ncbi:glycoside hydrolase family protein [Gynuella sunshinyii]|uniref:Lysozyme n=1 Tax=Gynuella sunshinyii YC6258 TaxID=1445510 RepID=A0A0C5VV51_9GAMM|nr:glycoside hydrolase family protein [Gynuella sunshinyii]AJQ94264.1 hypothetical Protein YC6258_02226 [Gynuella sunshinyii YC6258]
MLSEHSKQLLQAQLIRHEGLKTEIYRCPAGRRTIGVGRNLDDKGLSVEEAAWLLENRGRSDQAKKVLQYGISQRSQIALLDKGITVAEAQTLLDHDIDDTCQRLNSELPVYLVLDQCRRRVLINMAFNLGVNGLLKFKNMLAALANRDFSRAAVEMLDSKWARQVGKRAEELAREMETGQ